MRKWRTLACLLLLALTIPAAWRLRNALPSDTQPMIEKKYGGWSGVLRLWVIEGDGAAAWLNRCIAAFEKRHPGVYVQPEYVDANALEAEGVPLPDLLLFPPGKADADAFAPLSIDAPFRDELPRDDRAVPVLLGGYLWAYNAAMLDDIPNSWRDAGVPVSMLPDDADHLWSAALLALCSSKYSENSPAQPSTDPAELELGLSGDTPVTPAPAPGAGTLSCRLPEDFTPDDNAFRRLINGEIAAMPVTAREIRRLEALSDQGKGPDWRLAPAGDAAFTDQVLYIGTLCREDEDKLALCRAFIAHLLEPECQGELHRVGAFSVTEADSGYAPGRSLRAMEQLLRQKPLLVPAPFDTTWRQDAESIVRNFWRTDAEPAAIFAILSERIRR